MSTQTAIYAITGNEFSALSVGFCTLRHQTPFTDSGILQLRLYSGNAPLLHKIIGAGVVILLVWAGLRLLCRNLPDGLRALRGGDVSAWLLLATLGLYGVAKTLDGLGRKLAPLGIEISDWANRTAGRGEEAMELLGAILILQVVGLSLIRRVADHHCPGGGRAENKPCSIRSRNVLAE